MRIRAFSLRVAKEILRDPLSIAFGLGFPSVLLILMSLIQRNIPVPLFEIAHLTPGVAVFGQSFLALFSATVISRDRESALFPRLLTTPMRPFDFLIGYTIPLLPISLVQTVIVYLLALCFGLMPSGNVLLAISATIPSALLFIGLGLLFGTLCGVKQVGGLCGALLTNLSAWLSGIWFDLSLVGGFLEGVARALPFYHAVVLGRNVLSRTGGAFLPLSVTLIYALLIFVLAAWIFVRKTRK